MSRVLTIAASEWRYWLRSRLALAGALLFAALLIATSILTVSRIEAERAERAHHQAEAEETFRAQPDRHPHRMVHYGHYVFRAPAPLAVFDPGLDPVTGQSIFLEGHRQNSAMFAGARASADLGGLSWLSPALVYQMFGPLLMILLGHGALAREREARALAPLLAQGTSGILLIAGKALALTAVVGLLLLPFIPVTATALAAGESLGPIMVLAGVYAIYLGIWGALALLASALFARRAMVLSTLMAAWFCFVLLIPSVAVNMAERAIPLAGKIETDLAMLTDLRQLGDGHNANDPAFDQLRADLLKQYGVERVEDLPVNLRGIVAQYAEGRLTETLNAYAERRMLGEAEQAKRFALFGWGTPMLAATEASRAVSGTDLSTHHRFLREAEALRFDFVQALNRVHAEQLAYTDDINRSGDAEAERRTRVDAANWQILQDFRFEPADGATRLSNAGLSILMLIVWFGFVSSGLMIAAGRIKP